MRSAENEQLIVAMWADYEREGGGRRSQRLTSEAFIALNREAA
jgi:hypothetical protein